jgi:hypothetical protein
MKTLEHKQEAQDIKKKKPRQKGCKEMTFKEHPSFLVTLGLSGH